jgi:hypothetical protein
VGRGELIPSLTGGWAAARWPGVEAARWWSMGGLGGAVLRRRRGGEESLVRGGMPRWSSGGGFYRGRGGGEWSGEAEKRPAMGRLQWPGNSGSSRRVKARLEGGVTAKE